MTDFNGIIQAVLGIWAAIFVVFIYVSSMRKNLMDDEAGKRLGALYIGVFAMLILESIAYLARGKVNGFSFVAVRVCNFLYFEGNFVMAFLYYRYLRSNVSEKGLNNPKIYENVVLGIGGVGTLLLLSNLFTKKMYSFDSQNVYQRGNLYFAYLGLILANDIVMLYLLLLHKDELSRKKFWVLLSYTYLPILAIVFLLFSYGISFGTLALVASLLINYEYRNQEDDDDEGTTLNATDDLTPFELEKAHVESYLEIEQERLGGKLKVEWNIKVTDFLIPPLTLQILVENAVRQGVSKRIEGCTVVIKTEEKIGEVVISVGDDGRGFDPALLEENVEYANSAHMGLLDIKKRVRLFCNGEVEIMSTPNVGTLVKIHIPR